MAIETIGHVKAFTAAEALGQYVLVRTSAASGTAVELCDAVDTPIGVVAVDDPNLNTDSPVAVRMLAGMQGTCKITAAGSFSIDDLLYPADDGRVDDVPNGRAIFIALEAAGAAGDIVEVRPLSPGEAGSRLVFMNSAVSTAHTNTTTAASFDVVAIIQPEDIVPGDVLEVKALVNATATNSTDTLTLRLLFAGEEIITTTAVDVADGDFGVFHAFIRFNSIGAAASIKGHGYWALGVPGSEVNNPFIKAAATEDISAAWNVAVEADWSVANAGNSCVLTDLVVIRHRN